MEYGMQLIIVTAVWAAFFIICILVYSFSFLIMCCHSKHCCCYCCCKKNLNNKKSPYSKTHKLVSFVLFAIGSAGIIGCSIAGYVINKDVTTGFKTLTCSIVWTIDELNNGDSAGKWVGLKPAVQII